MSLHAGFKHQFQYAPAVGVSSSHPPILAQNKGASRPMRGALLLTRSLTGELTSI